MRHPLRSYLLLEPSDFVAAVRLSATAGRACLARRASRSALGAPLYRRLATLVLLSGFAACAAAEPESVPTNRSFHSYSAADGSMCTTLVVDDLGARQYLASVTHFEDGSRLEEQATTDRWGRLIWGEYKLSGRAARAHVVLDPRAGVVEVSGPIFPLRWSVPNDMPWVWAPLLDTGRGIRPTATPLAALVTLRAAGANGALRTIDLGAFESYTVPAAQLMVRDSEERSLVYVGADAVAALNGLPDHWYLGALGQDVGVREPKPSTMAAACAAVERLKT